MFLVFHLVARFFSRWGERADSLSRDPLASGDDRVVAWADGGPDLS
jgi:hypothetical protein